MVAQDAVGNPMWRCSGTLLSESLFLTAGHCTESLAAHVEIWFDADVQSGIPANGYPLTGDVGGTCFGDSGGPNFLGDTNVVAGVTSFGLNSTCGGTGGVYRVDRSDDLDRLYGTFGSYLP